MGTGFLGQAVGDLLKSATDNLSLADVANTLKDGFIQKKATTCSADFSSLENVESYLMQELTKEKPDFESFGCKVLVELTGDNKNNARKVMDWALAYLAQKGQTEQYTSLRSNAPKDMTFQTDAYCDEKGNLKEGATFPTLTQEEIQNLDFNKSVFEQPIGLFNLEKADLTYRDMLTTLGKCTPNRFKTLFGALGTLTKGADLPPVFGHIQYFLNPTMPAPETPDAEIPDLSAKVMTPGELGACQGTSSMDLANRAFASINTAPEGKQEECFLNFYKILK